MDASPADPEPASPAARMAARLGRTYAFQAAALRELEDRAAALDPVVRCAGWIALQRQSDRVLRTATMTSGAAWLEPHREMVEAQASLVTDIRRRAAEHVGAFSGETRRGALGALGIRVSVLGKGGSGKSLLAGTLARVLARSGHRVLAVDLDTSASGLAVSLGVPVTDAGLPPDALDGDLGWETQLAPGLLPIAAVERYAGQAPDGVRCLLIGKHGAAGGAALQRSIGPLGQILYNFAPSGWDVIADLEGGVRSPSQGYHLFTDMAVLVLNPSWKSAITVRRLRRLVTSVPTVIVANAWRDEPDFPGLEPLARIPYDTGVVEAESRGVAAIDHAPEAPAVRAVEALAPLLVEEVTRAASGALDGGRA